MQLQISIDIGLLQIGHLPQDIPAKTWLLSRIRVRQTAQHIFFDLLHAQSPIVICRQNSPSCGKIGSHRLKVCGNAMQSLHILKNLQPAAVAINIIFTISEILEPSRG